LAYSHFFEKNFFGDYLQSQSVFNKNDLECFTTKYKKKDLQNSCIVILRLFSRTNLWKFVNMHYDGLYGQGILTEGEGSVQLTS
jgi:hypothetical protein